MCGIGVVIGNGSHVEEGSHAEEVASVLQRRGPDHVSVHHSQQSVTLMATVLHMRGDDIVHQPVNLDCGKLCWNGEVYQYHTNQSDSLAVAEEVPPHQSDTDLVASLLLEAFRTKNPPSSALQAVTSVMSQLWNAEFAFCLLTEKALYYGRDVLGRRSLLTCSNTSDSNEMWKLSSVALSTDDESWQELPPGIAYEYNLATREIQSMPMIQPVLKLKPALQLSSQLADNGYVVPLPGHVVASESMWKASLQLEHLLRQAVERRLVCRHSHSQDPIGVLFSGGLDSVVLAGMACDFLLSQPDNTNTNQILELYNVAFGDGDAADRRAGLQCYQELKALHPDKDIRLVLVDIGEWESVVEEERRVQQLIYPKTSVMDLNIGTALWFASRGIGATPTTTTTVAEEPYEGKAKILLLGMGADEQLGGYGRHRKAYAQGSLRQELDLDVGRIWERNLGRDDRVLSDHGKEARFPFLDPNVMQFLANTVALEDICDFELPPGQGDKRILRLVAQRMGLKTASGLVKRAIQFGSRIAHVSDKQRFGSRRAAKGTTHYKGSRNNAHL